MTWFVNRVSAGDAVQRGLTLAQMLAIGAMAVTVPKALEEGTSYFALAYAVVRILLIVMYIRAAVSAERLRPLARIYVLGFSLGAAIWVVSAFVDPPLRYMLWGVGLVVDFWAPHNRRALGYAFQIGTNGEHLTERFGLFTIIVIGESIAKVAGSLVGEQPELSWIAYGAMALVIIGCLWWIYFDDVAGAEIEPTTASVFAWVYTHVPLTLGLLGVAVGLTKVFHGDPLDPLDGKYAWLIGTSAALALASTAVIERVTRRSDSRLDRQRRMVVRIAAAVLMLAVAAVHAWLPAWALLGAMTLIAASQPVLDLTVGVRSAAPAQ